SAHSPCRSRSGAAYGGLCRTAWEMRWLERRQNTTRVVPMLESRRCKAPEDSCFESMAENAVYALMRRHIAQRDGIGDRFVGTGSPVNFQSDNTVGRSWQSRRERTS